MFLNKTTAVTDHGKTTADKIIVATNFPFLNKRGSYFLKMYQHRSYVVALENAPNVEGMYADEAQKGMFFRNCKDFLIIGGGDCPCHGSRFTKDGKLIDNSSRGILKKRM